MAVRPCSRCGGSGWLEEGRWPDHAPADMPCPRCEGMPKLHPVVLPAVDVDAHMGRGWFFSDPDTVMWWCEEHMSAINDMDRNWCEGQELENVYSYPEGVQPDEWRRCRPVWVARPTRLEIVE